MPDLQIDRANEEDLGIRELSVSEVKSVAGGGSCVALVCVGSGNDGLKNKEKKKAKRTPSLLATKPE